MREPGLVRLFALLDPVLCVGGAVRNVLMGRAVEDVDLATPIAPQEVMRRLEAAGIRVIPTGIDHGTVTAVIDGKAYEITTLRRDVETDGRRAVVAYTNDWVEDARRRDFTINTLLLDIEGNVYDPLRAGIDDLDKGQVRFVGAASERIAEDYLRVLRFFRFHALYASSAYDPEALASCAAAADKIGTLSRERISQEFFKIIASTKPRMVFDVMAQNGILREILPPDYDGTLLEHVSNFQENYTLVSVPVRVLALAGLKMERVQAMEQMVLFPKVFLRDMESISGVLTLSDLSDEKAVREAVYRFGRVATAQALMVELALDRVMSRVAPSILKILQGWDVPAFPLDGNDLMAAGIKPGKTMGEILDRIEGWWIAQDFKPDKSACLKQV